MGIVRDYIRRVARAVGLDEFRRSLQVRKRAKGILRLLQPLDAVQRSDPGEYPLHRNESVAPFFIVGSGRCGTTLMRRLLQASPKIHIPPENWAMRDHVAAFQSYNWLLSWRDLVDFHLGRHVLNNDRWFNKPPFELRKQLLQLSGCERSLARLLDLVYRHHGQLQGATFERWGDKTPLNVECMEQIIDVFPKARFIHLLRDGVDVVHSYYKLKRHRYYGEVVSPARRWKSAVTSAHDFRAKHPDRFLEIRYEDLCEDPETALRRVCPFINLSYEEDMLTRSEHYGEMRTAQSISHYENAFEEITTDSVGKGRERLNAEQKNEIKPLINTKLTDLGYAPVEV